MRYHKINEQDLNYFKTIFIEKHILTNEQIIDDYSKDELGTVSSFPDIVLIITHKEQVIQVMQYAHQNLIQVTVRGSGTGLVGACVAVTGGILLDMSHMNKIIELDKENLTLRVEPGVLLLDISQYVENEGLFYAPDPGEKTATIGGNISTNAGGMRAVKYGVTRDWVRGLEVVLADGSLIQLGGKVVKNSTGYDLKDLIIGSEGTLAIIVEATLKLIAKPNYSVSLLVPFKTRKSALNVPKKLLSQGAIPTAIEFFEHNLLEYSASFLGKKMPHNEHPAYLLISFDGDSEDIVDQAVNAASVKLIDELEAIDVYLIDTEERKTSVWNARGAFLEAIKASTPQMDECDVVLPRANIYVFLNYVDELSAELKVRIPFFGHLGDGNLHLYLCKDQMSDQLFQEVTEKGFHLMYEKAAQLGGLVSGEHGIGYAKRKYMANQLGSNHMKLMKAIKNAFDPNNILNPNKVL
jgi:glycolate oxidase